MKKGRWLLAVTLFRLHLPNEPASLNPQKQRTSAASYVMQNLHRGLLIHDGDKPVPALAEKCRWLGKNRLTCRLRKDVKWSDGQPITADDFVRSFRALLNPAQPAFRADLLFPLVNGADVAAGRLPMDQLGLRAVGARDLEIDLREPFPEFEHNLAHPALAPVRLGDNGEPMAYSGPFRLGAWDRGRRLRLTANPAFPGAGDRPDVEFRFVEEDSVALKLYEKNELDFLRRLPTAEIPRFRSSPEHHDILMLRFDYLGFGPGLKDRPGLRKALLLALNYPELQTLLASRGRPGCAGLPGAWFESGQQPCYHFDAAAARAARGDPPARPLSFLISALGGDDSYRAAEWEQGQWKKHLQIDVQLRMLDNKAFLERLKTQTPDVFRKGVAPDRPTCSAALEPFTSGHIENYIGLKDPEFDGWVQKARTARSEKSRRRHCEKAIKMLMGRHIIIPLGEFSFSVLAKPRFTGWKLNSMNQLDLTGLRAR